MSLVDDLFAALERAVARVEHDAPVASYCGVCGARIDQNGPLTDHRPGCAFVVLRKRYALHRTKALAKKRRTA